MDALTPDQLAAYYQCMRNGRQGFSISYASCALFLFDYALTIHDEMRFVWKPRIVEKNVSLAFLAFLAARYPGLLTTILILAFRSEMSLTMINVTTALKLVTIIASEFVLAVRTWAIWERGKLIFYVLLFFSLSAVIPAAIIIARDIITSEIGPPIAPSLADITECRIAISSITHAYIVPYILTIIYEAVTLSLSLSRIIQWRRQTPKTLRTPLMDTLWKDGILYYSWMLALGFVNIGMVLQTENPQVRTACSQLQMAFHSMLSTRIVLHLAALSGGQNPRDPSSALTDTHIRFTTQWTVTRSRDPNSTYPALSVVPYEHEGAPYVH